MKLKDDNYYKNYTYHELIDEIERGLRKGYWDKRLLSEVRRRLKELNMQTKIIIGLINYKIKELEKEKENDK